ncbi:hypothetical protein HK405_003815, partial [Cladochytrium tenue]
MLSSVVASLQRLVVLGRLERPSLASLPSLFGTTRRALLDLGEVHPASALVIGSHLGSAVWAVSDVWGDSVKRIVAVEPDTDSFEAVDVAIKVPKHFTGTTTKMAAAIKNIFSRPTSGPIADNIDKATSEQQQDIDWTHVIACSQLINANPAEGLPARIKQKVVVNYSLVVLDAMVKNCGRPFAAELASKDNLAFLQKFLLRENLAPENRGRLLELVSDWAEHITDPPEIRMFFHQLIGQGEYDAVKALAVPAIAAVPAVQPRPEIQDVSPSERRKWVAFDCNLSDSNLQMFVEAVNFADRDVPLANAPIVQEFKGKCEDMQKRLTRLIDKVTEEDLVDQLIKTHSRLSSGLEQYELASTDRTYRIEIPSDQPEPAARPAPPAVPPPRRSPEDAAPRARAGKAPAVDVDVGDPFADGSLDAGGPSLQHFLDSDEDEDEANVYPSAKKLG